MRQSGQTAATCMPSSHQALTEFGPPASQCVMIMYITWLAYQLNMGKFCDAADVSCVPRRLLKHRPLRNTKRAQQVCCCCYSAVRCKRWSKFCLQSASRCEDSRLGPGRERLPAAWLALALGADQVPGCCCPCCCMKAACKAPAAAHAQQLGCAFWRGSEVMLHRRDAPLALPLRSLPARGGGAVACNTNAKSYSETCMAAWLTTT